MRLRNIPHADDVILAHAAAIKNETEQKGNWHTLFGNNHPIHIEIGMGKGQFLLTLAKKYPTINYIGIERYSSVLLRALEKLDSEEYEGLTNIRFICMDAADISEVFEKRRSGKDLSEFLRSMAESTPCKKKTDFQRIFCPLRSCAGSRRHSRI